MSIAIKRPTVADYLVEKIKESGKSKTDVAMTIGYDDPKIIDAFTQGTVKVPADKIVPLAGVLGVDAAYLLRLVMGEYMPDMLRAIDETLQGSALSRNERELLEAYRRATNGTDAVAVICDAKDVVAMIMV